jgi:hypothetical protein
LENKSKLDQWYYVKLKTSAQWRKQSSGFEETTWRLGEAVYLTESWFT